MDYLSILINRVEIMLIIIVIGFILRKTNFIDDSITKTMGDIMTQIIVPLTIVNSFIMESSIEKTKLLGISFAVSILIHLVGIVIAFLVFKKEDTVERFTIIIGNVGFFGLAVALSVCGQEAAFYAAPFVAVNAFTLWTVGAYAMSNDKSVIKPKKIITNFNVIAIILGLLFYFTHLDIPQVFKDTITSLSNINSPVCGLIIGVGLAHTKFDKNTNIVKLVLPIFFKLFIVPLAAIYILKPLSNDYEIMKITLLLVSAVPAAATTNIFADKYKQDIGKATMIISVSTILCVLTMPFMMNLALNIWGI